MDYMNQVQGAPVGGANAENVRSEGQTAQQSPQQAGQYAFQPPYGQQPAGSQTTQPAGAYAGSQGGMQSSMQPQPGAFYQFQPGVGFVAVQGAAQQQTGQGQQDAYQSAGYQASGGYTMGAQATGATDGSTQAGMFGPGTPDGANPKFDQNKLGQMYGVVRDVMNGEADPSKVLGLLPANGADFWKGALVGAAVVVLLNNDSVKGAIAGAMGSVGAIFGEKDPEGPQVTLD